MTATDTGPLVALANSNESAHNVCKRTLLHVALPLRTTVACFTEAMYLLDRELGFPGQVELWNLYGCGVLAFHFSNDVEIARMRVLMTQYRDAPMDFADASLVAMLESLRLQRVFTLDRHFYAYRAANGEAFEVVP